MQGSAPFDSIPGATNRLICWCFACNPHIEATWPDPHDVPSPDGLSRNRTCVATIHSSGFLFFSNTKSPLYAFLRQSQHFFLQQDYYFSDVRVFPYLYCILLGTILLRLNVVNNRPISLCVNQNMPECNSPSIPSKPRSTIVGPRELKFIKKLKRRNNGVAGGGSGGL